MDKKILKLAIPNIITNITVPLLGMVDLILMGYMGSEQHIGAIALGGVIFSFIYSGFSFLRMSTTGFTAQFYGKKNKDELAAMFFRATLLAVLFGLLMIALKEPIAWLSFGLVEGSPRVEEITSNYYNIRVLAAPATIGLFAVTGWLIGMQNAIIPMIIAILINILNIGFNLLFVLKFSMKAEGVAMGTLIAQYIGFFVVLIIIKKKYSWVFEKINLKQILDIEVLKQFFNVNKDIFIRTIVLMLVLAFFTSKSASNGDVLLAVNTLLMQFFFIFSYFIDGFAHAAESLTGKYFGIGDRNLLKKLIKRLFVYGMYISIVFSSIYFLFGTDLLQLLTNKSSIISASTPFIYWISLIPLATFSAFLWDGIYIGATSSSAMRNSMLFSAIIVFVPIWYFSSLYIGNHALWLALLLFMLSRGVTLTIMAKKNIMGNV